MAKQAVYQVRMDEEIKDQVETLYRNMGTTFAEAIRIFAVQSIREQGMPFTPSEKRGSSFGVRGLSVGRLRVRGLSIRGLSVGRLRVRGHCRICGSRH